MLGSVSEFVSLTGLGCGREPFAFDTRSLAPTGIAATRTNNHVLPRFRHYAAGLQDWFLFHAFHLLPGVSLARVYSPKKEEWGRSPYSSFPMTIVPPRW